eukprot:TRINITY_DN4403_c0_g1_i3.p2 TRINITY_DN4403_c0_g1~~TRINITY_DN4403_c0_g1_i3.p2  ORF type:complete len:211 (-),score=16.51 TRINITY_DN4403_c0_g1_i3:416-1048(-)
MVQFLNNQNLAVVNEDVLEADIPKLLSERFGVNEPQRVKVIANLPYNITSECLKKMLTQSDQFSVLYFMLQDDVAQRLVPTKPAGSGYRAMTVFTHHYSQPKYLFKISKEKYYPEPQVDGALVRFVLKTESERINQENEKRFLQFINLGFQQKRKTLKNSVKGIFPSDITEAALEKSGVNREARIQELSFEQTHQVFAFAQSLLQEKKQI